MEATTMNLVLHTKNLVFNITKHNPLHPTIKNQLSFSTGVFPTDLRYYHNSRYHCIKINNDFTEWNLVDLETSSVLYDGSIIATLADNIEYPAPYNYEGGLSASEVIHFDDSDGAHLILTRYDVTINLPIENYDVDYSLRGKTDNPFDKPTIRYAPIKECINSFFSTHHVTPLSFPSYNNSADFFDNQASPFGQTDPFGQGFFNGKSPFNGIVMDNKDIEIWVLNTKFKLVGLDDFIRIHEFLTDDKGNKVWVPQALGCEQLSDIKLALNIPDIALGQEIGLDEIIVSQYGTGITNIVTPTQAITIRLEHDIPRITIWIDRPQY